MSGNFTFPTEDEYRFIVADQVNVTWDVVAPVISLYESCGANDFVLQDRISNNYSYVWTATRKGYVESGCAFTLQPFTAQHESYGNNITSVLFGVSKRYTDDPAPVEYNFANVSTSTSTSSSPAEETETSTSSPTAGASQPTTTPTSQSSNGLSKASKIGIGLGVPLGVLLVALAVGFILYRRRKSRRKEIREVTATAMNQPGDGLAPLPTFVYKDPHQTRFSQAETIGTSSQFSGDNHRAESDRLERPPSELMSIGRAELG